MLRYPSLFVIDNPWFCTEKSQPTRTKFEYRTVACKAAILTLFGAMKDFREWHDYSVIDFVLAFVTVNLKTHIILTDSPKL
jgi:hypothetical protein